MYNSFIDLKNKNEYLLYWVNTVQFTKLYIKVLYFFFMYITAIIVTET